MFGDDKAKSIMNKLQKQKFTLEELQKIEPELRKIQRMKKLKKFNEKVNERNKEINKISFQKDVQVTVNEQ